MSLNGQKNIKQAEENARKTKIILICIVFSILLMIIVIVLNSLAEFGLIQKYNIPRIKKWK